MRSVILLALLGAMFLLASTGAGEARSLALLVGISGYPKDHSGNEFIKPLGGPRNDVTLMWRPLRANGFEGQDNVVLANGLPVSPEFPRSAADPTRSAILGAFATLAERAAPGDFAYVHVLAWQLQGEHR